MSETIQQQHADFVIDPELEELFHSDPPGFNLEAENETGIMAESLPEWLIGVIVIIILLVIAFFVMVVSTIVKNKKKSQSVSCSDTNSTSRVCDDMELGKISLVDPRSNGGLETTNADSNQVCKEFTSTSPQTGSDTACTSTSSDNSPMCNHKNPLFVDDDVIDTPNTIHVIYGTPRPRSTSGRTHYNENSVGANTEQRQCNSKGKYHKHKILKGSMASKDLNSVEEIRDDEIAKHVVDKIVTDGEQSEINKDCKIQDFNPMNSEQNYNTAESPAKLNDKCIDVLAENYEESNTQGVKPQELDSQTSSEINENGFIVVDNQLENNHDGENGLISSKTRNAVDGSESGSDGSEDSESGERIKDSSGVSTSTVKVNNVQGTACGISEVNLERNSLDDFQFIQSNEDINNDKYPTENKLTSLKKENCVDPCISNVKQSDSCHNMSFQINGQASSECILLDDEDSESDNDHRTFTKL